MDKELYNDYFKLAIAIRKGLHDTHRMTEFITNRLANIHDRMRVNNNDFLNFSGFKKWVLTLDFEGVKKLFDNIFSVPFEKFDKDYPLEERFVPVKRIAMDGKVWWVVYDKQRQSYSQFTNHGKYKTESDCLYAIKNTPAFNNR